MITSEQQRIREITTETLNRGIARALEKDMELLVGFNKREKTNNEKIKRGLRRQKKI